MKIIQNDKTGDGEIIFSEEEKKIINKKSKIILPALFFKDFCNSLLNILFNFNENFSSKLLKRTTKIGKKIKSK
jgi:hypothetical protein